VESAHGHQILRRTAGPALIAGAVLVVLWPLLSGRVFPAQIDLLGYWLPTYRFLARTLALGHVPAWNPHVLGGAPFVADPQSGWISPTAVALFAVLPPLTALRWFLVLQPIVAGLGVYRFLRDERASRAAATVGGLVLALGVAGSRYVALPWLSASLAWTAVTLAAAARWAGAEAWPRRLVWTLLVALAWGQILVAHPSNGLAVGTLALILYLVMRVGSEVRSGRRSLGDAALASGILALSLPLVNLASILPRIAGLPGTTEALGYEMMMRLSTTFSGGRFDGFLFPTGHPMPTWPLSFSLSPGLYLGAAALVLAFAGWFAPRRRALVAAFSILGAICYALTLAPAVRAVEVLSGGSRLASLYLHAPNQFDFGVLLAVAVLVGLGLQAWIEAGSWRTRAAMVAPGILVWLVLPALWARPAALVVLAFGAVAGAIALVGAAARERAAALVPMVLAVELVVSGAGGQWSGPGVRAPARLEPYATPVMRTAELSGFERPGPIALALRRHDERFVSFDPERWGPWGYVARQRPDDAGLLGSQQSMVFGLEDAQGYNPWQLAAVWAFVRAAQPDADLRYASSYWKDLPPVMLDLLQVGWAVSPTSRPPEPGLVREAVQGEWGLFRLGDPVPRASVVPDWRLVPAAPAPAPPALLSALEPGFDPAREAILERDPGIPHVVHPQTEADGGSAGAATYRALGPASARIDVTAVAPAIVLVRNAFAPHWRATVDGRSAPVLRADGMVQGVPVQAGTHTIVLNYEDPWIGYGMLGSLAAVAALLMGALVTRRRRSSRPR
jgi:hypothetical protein